MLSILALCASAQAAATLKTYSTQYYIMRTDLDTDDAKPGVQRLRRDGDACNAC